MIICLWDLQMHFGEFVVLDEHRIRAVDDDIFGRSGNLEKKLILMLDRHPNRLNLNYFRDRFQWLLWVPYPTCPRVGVPKGTLKVS